ncbi:MAG: inositol monophosphatase [Gammaproteobacteria bacterium]|nr:inositol monophosphatase [Gammaproteobacteria bacterium]
MEFFTKTAVDVAVLAGKHLLSKYKRHHVEVYGEDTLSVSNRGLTKEITSSLDNEADQIIIDVISERHPEHNILTEETGQVDNGGSPYTWIIDPLDGSSNYVNHNPFFAVSVCLAYENVPITGVIFAPYIEELAVARKGHGCTLNGRPVYVSDTAELSGGYIVGCPGGDLNNDRFAMMSYVLNKSIKDFRKMGSAAIEAYTVASGRVDAFVTLNISPWDIAAGAVCVQEAGGMVTDFNGSPWDLSKSDVCMSNGKLHDSILNKTQVVNPSHPEYSPTALPDDKKFVASK